MLFFSLFQFHLHHLLATRWIEGRTTSGRLLSLFFSLLLPIPILSEIELSVRCMHKNEKPKQRTTITGRDKEFDGSVRSFLIEGNARRTERKGRKTHSGDDTIEPGLEPRNGVLGSDFVLVSNSRLLLLPLGWRNKQEGREDGNEVSEDVSFVRAHGRLRTSREDAKELTDTHTGSAHNDVEVHSENS